MATSIAIGPTHLPLVVFKEAADKYHRLGTVGTHIDGSFLQPQSCANNAMSRCLKPLNLVAGLCGGCRVVQVSNLGREAVKRNDLTFTCIVL